MNARRTRRLALATLLVCLGASGEAQVQFIEFTGRVVDAGSGQGIENLEIKLTPPKGVNLPIRLSGTDRDGKFLFRRLARSRYLIEVSQGLYLLYRAEVDTTQQETVEITLKRRS